MDPFLDATSGKATLSKVARKHLDKSFHQLRLVGSCCILNANEKDFKGPPIIFTNCPLLGG